ncbi:MAG: serine/threonine protein kinase [Planctomycetes bacterium]|nr:serine/threonine protein kinase [Planctomycetota bacterium]MCB9869584.1 serine/threonine protein kinase [Planctomycetota bacterium]
MSGGSEAERLSVPDEERRVALVEAALAEREAGREPDLEAICAGCPELIPLVAQALGLDAALPGTAADATAPRSAHAGLEGRILLGRYRLGACIGLGAMGAVYEAHDARLGRTVAVKVMHPGLGPDATRRARFAREARVLAALRSPAIVPVHDQGETEDGLYFLVMDRLEGISLAGVLQYCTEHGIALRATGVGPALGVAMGEHSLLRQLVAWVVQLADGLQAAHDASVLHRDVKPSNAFVTRDGGAVLLDFGIATRDGEGALTLTATALGTPWYMAPEQARRDGRAAIGPAADVYGLGATLYHLLTRCPPHQGSIAEVLTRLQLEDPVRPAAIDPAIPRDLEAVVERALAKQPARRYPTMQAFADDLRAFLDHRPVAARPLGRFTRTWRKVQRRPARYLALGATLLAVLLAVVVVPLYRHHAAVRRAARSVELMAGLPALLVFESYPERRLEQDRELAAVARERLDELLRLAPDDLGARMTRAALCLDRGEVTACRADVEQIAARVGTPYAAALAAAYRRLDASALGAAAVDTRRLPEPRTDDDRYLALFHALRGADLQHDPKAPALLEGLAANSLASRELRQIGYLFLAGESTRADQRRQLFAKARDEALQLEGVYRRRTARTAHVIGCALAGLREYADAIPVLRASLALCPERHGPLQNLGICLRRLGRLDEAEQCLRRAHALRPWLWNTLQTFAQVQCDRGAFAAAREAASAMPATGKLGEAWKRPLLLARIDLQEAFRCRAERAAAARQLARTAQAGFARSRAAGGPSSIEPEQALASAFARDDLGELLPRFLGAWRRDWTNPVQILNFEALLPDSGLDAEQVLFLRVYLLRLAGELSPQDPIPPARLRALLEHAK